ncbi:MAG TPA: hypothetical protein VH186_35385 [Chloroflexia bacterium]|nr:hypothetical protein [Chloroflexia bacterium]
MLKYYQVRDCRAEFGALRVENLRWLRRHLLGAAKAVEAEAYALFALNHATAPPFHK